MIFKHLAVRLRTAFCLILLSCFTPPKKIYILLIFRLTFNSWSYLIRDQIFVFMIAGITWLCLLVFVCHAYITAPTPKTTVSVFVFLVSLPPKYYHCTLSFQVFLERRYILVRWYPYQHIYVMRSGIAALQ